MLGSRLSLNRLAEWIERRSWLVQLWLWALSCMRHRPTKYPKKRLLGKVIVSVDVAVGSCVTSYAGPHGAAQLYERWRRALRFRQSCVDLKPPQAAVVKSDGGAVSRRRESAMLYER